MRNIHHNRTVPCGPKERPILFSGPMIRAERLGLKNQTRRTNGLDYFNEQPDEWCFPDKQGHLWRFTNRVTGEVVDLSCPYGVPGDRLWVKETHAIFSAGQYDAGVGYRADHPYGGDLSKGDGGYNFRSFDGFATAEKVRRMENPDRWRPSIFMPRWASRTLHEVLDVRVERLQNISYDDCFAEGITEADIPDGCPVEAYCNLWESINGKDSWDKNPWVWVIHFKRIETERAV